jgi:hypothetical protein
LELQAHGASMMLAAFRRVTIWLSERWRSLVSAAVVIVLVPFLLASQGVIKGYVEGLISGCLFVLDVNQLRPQRFRVRAHLYGEPPRDLPLTFSADGAVIHRIAMVNEAELDPNSKRHNLALHPQTNHACPGALCEEYGGNASAPKITLKLADLRPEFEYVFHVDVNEPLDSEALIVYVQFDEGLKSGVCRIEKADLFNAFARQTRWMQFFLFVVLSIVAYLLVELFKRNEK